MTLYTPKALLKKSFFVLLLMAVLTGCKLGQYTMGMTKTEFLKTNKLVAGIVEDSAERTVYKIVFNENSTIYYYFTDDKLVRVDDGGQKPDVIIEHRGL